MTTWRPHLQMPFINHRRHAPESAPREMSGALCQGGPLRWSVAQWCWARQLVHTRQPAQALAAERGSEEGTSLCSCDPGRLPGGGHGQLSRLQIRRAEAGETWLQGSGKLGVGEAGRGDGVDTGLPGCFQ